MAIVLQILMSVNPIPVRMEGRAWMERDPTRAPAQNSIWAPTVKVLNYVVSQQLKHFWSLGRLLVCWVKFTNFAFSVVFKIVMLMTVLTTHVRMKDNVQI